MARHRLRRNPSDPVRRAEAEARLTRIKQEALRKRIDASRARAAQLGERAGRGAAYARVGVQEFPLTTVLITGVIAGAIGYWIGKPAATTTA